MIPKECKRLIEVDFPIAEVSKQSAREKSIRQGHPSTLHLWWARRPLAACRSVLMGLLLPDPCDEQCPDEFKKRSRELLPKLVGEVGHTDADLRAKLLKFIADFSNWDHAGQVTYLEVARGLVKAAHGTERPLVVDPFAGGGSIPLEALRIGCDAFASDLNPVACLINEVLLEDIPRNARLLAEDLRRVGAEITEHARSELKAYYPTDTDGSRPIAYIWARTVNCENPGCGAEIPLMRSFWLSKKAGRKRAMRHSVLRTSGVPPKVTFEIFTPKKDTEVQTGTVQRGNATCICCNAVLPVERVRQQLTLRRGGADSARLIAVVALSSKTSGRIYRLPIQNDFEAIQRAVTAMNELATHKLENGLSLIPIEPLPAQGTLGFRVRKYGMETWGDLFTARQKVEIVSLIKHCAEYSNSRPIKHLLVMALGRCVDHWSANAMWIQDLEAVAHTFGRQALPLVWDFVEAVGFGDGGASFQGAIDWVSRVIESSAEFEGTGEIQLKDARSSSLPDDACQVWFTDPPYYDAVPYADLSDYFYVWQKRLLSPADVGFDPRYGSDMLTPKINEIVQDETKEFKGKPKDKAFFEESMAEAFREGHRVLEEDGVACIVFAHKTTEGWEAFLNGILKADLVITASWPITTERPVRLRSLNSAALSASIHLVCRPRPENAGIGDWQNVLQELPLRIGEWMERLDGEGIHGADLVFSCIGPALEVFSRYDRVETAEGRVVELAEYLEKVWEVVGRSALEQILGTAEARARNGASGVLEEDARLTALFLWTLLSNANADDDDDDDALPDEDSDGDGKKKMKPGYVLIYDVARRFTQPLGIDLEKWTGRIIEKDKGIVRLLSVKERAKQLLGAESASAIAAKLEQIGSNRPQLMLFPDEEVGSSAPKLGRSRKRQNKAKGGVDSKRHEATTLDKVHAAMLLQASGQPGAMQALIEDEQKRSPDFLRLANALSALYPKKSEEKRLLDAMLYTVKKR